MNTPLSLGKTCVACGTTRKSKALRYDPTTFAPYCENPYICNDDHPNSVKNLIANQRETPLLKHDEAVEAYRKYLSETYSSSDIVTRIHKMLTDPSTIRIQNPEMARFLLEFQEEKGIKSLSETIRHCIEIVMENRGMFLKEYREAAEEKRKEEVLKEAIEKIETVPDENDDDDELVF